MSKERHYYAQFCQRWTLEDYLQMSTDIVIASRGSQNILYFRSDRLPNYPVL